jgi:hypothetical protein
VHVQRPCGGGDIAAMLGEYLLQVFPFQAFYRQWLFSQAYTDVTLVAVQCSNDLVGGRGLGQVVHGAEFDGLHCGGHAGVAGEHDYARVFVQFRELSDQFQPGFGTDAQIDHGVFRLDVTGQSYRIRQVVCDGYVVIAFCQRRAEYFAIVFVIINQ